MSINAVTMSGYLGKDPELTKTTNGISITKISIGVARNFKSKTSGKYETDWFDWRFFKETADAISAYLHKGDLVTVSGNAQSESWEDRQTGQKKHRIVFIGNSIQFPKRNQSESATTEEAKAKEDTSQSWTNTLQNAFDTGQKLVIDSEDLPF